MVSGLLSCFTNKTLSLQGYLGGDAHQWDGRCSSALDAPSPPRWPLTGQLGYCCTFNTWAESASKSSRFLLADTITYRNTTKGIQGKVKRKIKKCKNLESLTFSHKSHKTCKTHLLAWVIREGKIFPSRFLIPSLPILFSTNLTLKPKVPSLTSSVCPPTSGFLSIYAYVMPINIQFSSYRAPAVSGIVQGRESWRSSGHCSSVPYTLSLHLIIYTAPYVDPSVITWNLKYVFQPSCEHTPPFFILLGRDGALHFSHTEDTCCCPPPELLKSHLTDTLPWEVCPWWPCNS